MFSLFYILICQDLRCCFHIKTCSSQQNAEARNYVSKVPFTIALPSLTCHLPTSQMSVKRPVIRPIKRLLHATCPQVKRPVKRPVKRLLQATCRRVIRLSNVESNVCPMSVKCRVKHLSNVSPTSVQRRVKRLSIFQSSARGPSICNSHSVVCAQRK